MLNKYNDFFVLIANLNLPKFYIVLLFVYLIYAIRKCKKLRKFRKYKY